MTTLIAKPKGVGVGNLIQFIPVAKELKTKEQIFCDHQIYEILGVCPVYNGEKVDKVVLPLYPNWLSIIKTRLRFPSAKIIGFKYRVKGHQVGFFMTKSFMFDDTISEVENYEKYKNHYME